MGAMAQLVVAVAAVKEAQVIGVGVAATPCDAATVVQALLVNVFMISDVVPLTVVCT